MNCPEEKILQDFVDGELSRQDTDKITEHIRGCSSCKDQLGQLFTLQNALSQIVDADPCPSLEDLDSFCNKTCSPQQAEDISGHVELCSRCRSYVWAMGATEDEIAEWQKQEELEYQKSQKKEFGYDSIKEVLTKLLPSKINILEKTWQSAVDMVVDLRDKATDQWPAFGRQSQLAGVLGFDEAYDPQTEAASVILLTVLYISQEISEGRLEANTEDIKAEIIKVAPKFGAGKELVKRLLEFVPPVIISSR